MKLGFSPASPRLSPLAPALGRGQPGRSELGLLNWVEEEFGSIKAPDESQLLTLGKYRLFFFFSVPLILSTTLQT
jgi:hypothetical protein